MATYLRYNSSIKMKTGICMDCPPEKGEQPIVAGRCSYHYNVKLKLKSRDKILERDMTRIDVLNKWFEERRKEMKGVCLFCGAKSCKDSDVHFKKSIAHLFAKRPTMFPSLVTHPDNWIELCFWGKSHHTNFDNGIITFEQIKKDWPLAWYTIAEKTKILLPLMTKAEHGRMPEILKRIIIQL